MKRFLLLILLTAPGGAHIGSPDAFFEGDAGPYHLFVTIRKPPVVPGVAEFELRSPADDIKDVRIALGDAGRFDEVCCLSRTRRFRVKPIPSPSLPASGSCRTER